MEEVRKDFMTGVSFHVSYDQHKVVCKITKAQLSTKAF